MTTTEKIENETPVTPENETPEAEALTAENVTAENVIELAMSYSGTEEAEDVDYSADIVTAIGELEAVDAELGKLEEGSIAHGAVYAMRMSAQESLDLLHVSQSKASAANTGRLLLDVFAAPWNRFTKKHPEVAAQIIRERQEYGIKFGGPCSLVTFGPVEKGTYVEKSKVSRGRTADPVKAEEKAKKSEVKEAEKVAREADRKRIAQIVVNADANDAIFVDGLKMPFRGEGGFILTHATDEARAMYSWEGSGEAYKYHLRSNIPTKTILALELAGHKVSFTA